MKFKIILYFFKEGRNAYTINFEEREKYILEKQNISRKLLKQKRYEHARQVLKDTAELCESGAYEEDKKRLRSQHLTTLKNKSLCEWKLRKWKEMEEACREYVDLRQGKTKAKAIKEGKIAPHAQTINLAKTPAPEQSR